MVLWTTVAAVKLVQCGAGLDVFCGQSEGICLLTCACWAEETVTLTSDSKNFSPATGRIYIFFYFEIKKTLEKKTGYRRWKVGVWFWGLSGVF